MDPGKWRGPEDCTALAQVWRKAVLEHVQAELTRGADDADFHDVGEGIENRTEAVKRARGT